jgi:hypothetical protein
MRLRSSVDHMTVTEMLTQGFRFAMGEILKTSLSRFASQLAGIATKLPANIRRGPILDADEAEEHSVSFNLLDRVPAPQEPASASPVPHCRGPSIPGSALATRPEFGMVSLRQESFGKEDETRTLKPFAETLRVRIPPGRAGPAARSESCVVVGRPILRSVDSEV